MPAHVCCAWCQPPLHAVTSLVPASVKTEAELRRRFGGRAAAQAGMRIVSARPAPEADKEQVIAEMQARGARAYHPRGAVSDTPDYWAEYAVWLIVYEEAPCS